MAALGGLLLLVSLFLDWFKPDAREAVTAWTVFEALDLVLAAAAICALLVLASLFLRDIGLRPRILLPLGALAFLVVLSQLIDPPPAVNGDETETETGVWLALAGSALMLAGAILSAARVSLAVAPRADEAAATPAAPDPASDPRAVEQAARIEASENEPVVQAELYPEEARAEPLGSEDPEPWSAAPDDDTAPLPESQQMPPPDRGQGA